MFTLTLPAIDDTMRVATKDRLGGSRVAGIVRAWHAIDPRCVTCLTVTSYDGDAGDRPTFGHLIPASLITPGASGGKRGGYDARIAALQCVDCQHAIGNTVIERVFYVPAYFGEFPKTTRVAREDSRGKAAQRAMLGL